MSKEKRCGRVAADVPCKIGAFAAAASGVLAVTWLAGPGHIGWTIMVVVVALVSAGAWGCLLEGRGSLSGWDALSRPSGYYGFLFGAIAALAVLALADADASQKLAAGFACGAPLAQAVGRLCALVHRRFCGMAFHPAALYPIAGNLLVFVGMGRLWQTGAAASFIAGMYLVLSLMTWLMEEHCRGERQAARLFSLSVYQWLAILHIAAGIVLAAAQGLAVRAASAMTWEGIMASAGCGLAAALLSGVDFPASRRQPFFRLMARRCPHAFRGGRDRAFPTASRAGMRGAGARGIFFPHEPREAC